MCKRATILVMLGLALIGSEAGAKVADDGAEQLRAALQTWRQGDLDGALAQLRESLAVDSQNADTLAWMGEALRRKEEYAEAMAHCRRALTVAPDHAMALAVMGDLCNPQFAGDPGLQDQEESIRLYRRSLASDSHDPQALLGLCVWATRLGDDDTVRACLQAMADSGLWTASLLALDRWMLESAPANAILMLNGDADSYPIWILQQQGVRTDVMTCHLSLLNLEDYRTRLGAAGLPLPEGPLEHRTSSDGHVVTISQQVAEYLLQLSRDGSLDRPLAIATTVSGTALPEGAFAECHLRGGVMVHDAARTIPVMDVDATRPLMSHVPPEVMAGSWTSEQDRSPVSWRSNRHLRFNPMVVALRGFAQAVAREDRDLAAWYRQLYLAYRDQLGDSGHGQEFTATEAAFRELPE